MENRKDSTRIFSINLETLSEAQLVYPPTSSEETGTRLSSEDARQLLMTADAIGRKNVATASGEEISREWNVEFPDRAYPNGNKNDRILQLKLQSPDSARDLDSLASAVQEYLGQTGLTLIVDDPSKV